MEIPGSRALLQSRWCVHRWCERSVFAVDTSSGLNNISTVGWVWVFFGVGGYVQDKNTSARLCDKGGGVFVGHYGNCKYGILCHEFTSNMASVWIVMMLTRSQSWKLFFFVISCQAICTANFQFSQQTQCFVVAVSPNFSQLFAPSTCNYSVWWHKIFTGSPGS